MSNKKENDVNSDIHDDLMTTKSAEEHASDDNKDIQSDEISTLTQMQLELDEAREKYLRLFAEFDNFKKRSIKENFEIRRAAAKDTISSLLPVLDDFDRAKKNADNGLEVFSEGVALVYHKLFSILEHRGLKAMDSNGIQFDAEFHEAITDIPAPIEDMKGKVIDTIEKGYTLNDKIIRHAKVVVGK